MHHPAIKHTLSIFQRMHDNLPPLVPTDLVFELKEKLVAAYEDHHISLEELEDRMIYVGKKIWPYVRAFEELYAVYEHKLAHKLLEQRASYGVKKKIFLLREMGGSLHDIFYGKVHGMFKCHERQELVGLLVELKRDIRSHAMQAVRTHDLNIYTATIEKYGSMVQEINTVLEDLSRFAAEIEHEDVARDVHSTMRAIEHSLVFLGPRIRMDEIRNVLEYYVGKVHEKTFHI
ncbi:MAG: hypothetical protein HYV41_00805 [Candidatus Magasanikbacteria bacterium]|nr:hypothetical protein [Candidatus Magasanikbacteria bacterium]